MDLDEVENPRRETIRVGKELWNIKQMLWQDNIGSWHQPPPTWRVSLPD